MEVLKAQYNDLKDILELQKLCYHESGLRYNDFNIPPLMQTISEIKNDFDTNTFLKISDNSKIIASIRAYEKKGTCYIGRVIVHPEYQNQGLGKAIMQNIEWHHNKAKRFELFTGFRDKKNLYFYKKIGYEQFKTELISTSISIVYLEKYNLNP
ncbi:MAG: GNAT family N-acetyltransferase [Salinivirgaceae bacterium]|jgi:GNAT superfamily N-acetyltransferase|nr:GNAT family N-acetyltransferase [Salinivirgaceae bacterium]